MEILQSSVAVCAVVLLIYIWKILNWVWFKPKKLEKCLRQKGFNGNSYRLLFGDLKELEMMAKIAKSKPINFSNDIVPRVMPFIKNSVKNYGMFEKIRIPQLCFMGWLGVGLWVGCFLKKIYVWIYWNDSVVLGIFLGGVLLEENVNFLHVWSLFLIDIQRPCVCVNVFVTCRWECIFVVWANASSSYHGTWNHKRGFV